MGLYYPVLRGKRFELLALRELAPDFAAWGSIIPIVEPVRSAALETEFARAIQAMAQHDARLIVVLNPTVGQLRDRSGIGQIVALLDGLASESEEVRRTLGVGLAIGATTELREALTGLRAARFLRELPMVIWAWEAIDIEALGLDVGDRDVEVVVAPARRMISRVARRVGGSPRQVIFADPFPQLSSNANYVERGESIFTEEHLYLGQENLDGFSDLGTIGFRFTESGGAPRVVVIHWTYLKRVGQGDAGSPIYLRHFWSDPNDLSDIASRYGVASARLISYLDEAGIVDNPGTEAIRDYANRRAFPGLGMLKKMSILNHIHVVHNALHDADL